MTGQASRRRRSETLLDARDKPTAFVLPAGNTFQSQLNGQVAISAQKPKATVPWRVQPKRPDRQPDGALVGAGR
jgi:hypothetical protein